MSKNLASKILKVDGMICTSCETNTENAINTLDGVIKSKAEYSSSNVYVTYDIEKSIK